MRQLGCGLNVADGGLERCWWSNGLSWSGKPAVGDDWDPKSTTSWKCEAHPFPGFVSCDGWDGKYFAVQFLTLFRLMYFLGFPR